MELSTKRARPIIGELGLPGDKALSHLALVLGSLCEGNSGITGIGEGLDIEATKNCLIRLGVRLVRHKVREHEILVVQGRGPASLSETDDWLDCEDSEATIGLLMGVLAGRDMTSKLTGGADLRRVRLDPIADALRRMRASGWDHAERMLRHFGVSLDRAGSMSRVTGGSALRNAAVRLPGDMHLASYWVVAASIVAGSDLTMTEIGANPCRTAFLDILDRMGASIERKPWGDNIIGAPEPVGDLVVRSAGLKAVDVSPEETSRAVNELPVLAVAATQAKGRTRFKGLKVLGKEAETMAKATTKLVKAVGGKALVRSGVLTVTGPTPLKGARMEAGRDPRIAMAALIAGLVAEGEMNLTDGRCVVNAYPSFYSQLRLMCQ